MKGCFRPVYIGAFTADLASLFRSTIERSNIEVCPVYLVEMKDMMMNGFFSSLWSVCRRRIGFVMSTLSESFFLACVLACV